MRNILLMAVYYLVVTPVGAIARVVRDPLSRSWDPQAATYWRVTGPAPAKKGTPQ
jgi:hypothetical protein